MGQADKRLNKKIVVVVVAGFFVFFAAVSISALITFKLLYKTKPRFGVPQNLYMESQRLPRGAPLLGPSVKKQLKDSRKEEWVLLSTYGWIDHKTGIIHIPVERAIDIELEKIRAERSRVEGR